MAKLDAETEDFHHKKVSTSMAQDIQKARLSKKMTQAQLAQRINEKPQIINDYEAGRAIPNQQVSHRARGPALGCGSLCEY
mmetsp:Transcript_35276/g.140192  ORF Transcript_35276/g.140192 Transcript_35276/m.140192 type:complete len:81 (-) Transcript_35276:1195-1437(-)